MGNKDIKLVNPKGNHSEYSLEGLMLKLQHFSHLMQRVDSLEKPLMLRLPLMLGMIEGKGRRVQWKMRWLDSTTDSVQHESEQNSGDIEGQRSLARCSPWDHKI